MATRRRWAASARSSASDSDRLEAMCRHITSSLEAPSPVVASCKAVRAGRIYSLAPDQTSFSSSHLELIEAISLCSSASHGPLLSTRSIAHLSPTRHFGRREARAPPCARTASCAPHTRIDAARPSCSWLWPLLNSAAIIAAISLILRILLPACPLSVSLPRSCSSLLARQPLPLRPPTRPSNPVQALLSARQQARANP